MKFGKCQDLTRRSIHSAASNSKLREVTLNTLLIYKNVGKLAATNVGMFS